MSSTKHGAVRMRRSAAKRSTKRGPSRWRAGWLGRIVAIGLLFVFGLIVWAVLARAFAPRQNTSASQFDALIVLGYRADSDGNPTPTQLARVTEAVHEYEQGVAQHMILSGGPAYNQFVEAEVMGRTAEAQGVPASVIFEDRQALDTIQNACNSVRIMRAHGWKSAEVISSPYHLPRAAMIFSRMPIQWRMQTAPPLAQQSAAMDAVYGALETLKTVRYLAWVRREERCDF